MNIEDPYILDQFLVEKYKSGILPVVAEPYLKSLVTHIKNVRKAGSWLGVSLYQLEEHDKSKFSDNEFGPYAEKFYGQPDEFSFSKAWLHHLHNNPHHWQHWLLPMPSDKEIVGVEDGALPIPEHYALEMVADWLGSSKTYTGTWDMEDWLLENIPKIKLHTETAVVVSTILKDIGYRSVLNAAKFNTLNPY